MICFVYEIVLFTYRSTFVHCSFFFNPFHIELSHSVIYINFNVFGLLYQYDNIMYRVLTTGWLRTVLVRLTMARFIKNHH